MTCFAHKRAANNDSKEAGAQTRVAGLLDPRRLSLA